MENKSEFYRPEQVQPTKRGADLLRSPEFNKGTGFSLQERQSLGIHGLLPPVFLSQKLQAERFMSRLRSQPDDLSRYIQLDNLQERNEKLFYRVVVENVKECLPLVYTPTVGLACQKFGYDFRHPKGLYITINDNSVSKIFQILSNWPHKDVRAIVVTDGERILGLGDLGAQGMGIPVGKLSLYVALGGVQPRWCLPVCLDVGTDNQKLLDDPFYIGLRRKRERGDDYDLLVDNFMKAVVKRFGQDTLIQFEDFGNRNAYRLLEKYQKHYCMFNDDIQGTAAIVMAGLMSGSQESKVNLTEMKFLFFGAGEAGVGIADLLTAHLENEGVKNAHEKIFLVDSKGLITTKREKYKQGQEKYAKDTKEIKELVEIVREIKPYALIGTSTVGRSFTEEVVKQMAENHDRPLIFALSNPTENSECTAEEAYKWTNGKAIFAAGSPFDDVELNGKTYIPGQGNNAYIFPGVALGLILFKIKHIDSRQFLAAAQVVAEFTAKESGRIYPKIAEIRELSVQIAKRIAIESYKNGMAALYPEPENKELFIRSQIYNVDYDDFVTKPYDWPKDDMKQQD
ncbi:Malic enzyme [Aphelenchoides besseyi]|nr:Malic enzyme [Aphelenchoides besseyi]